MYHVWHLPRSITGSKTSSRLDHYILQQHGRLCWSRLLSKESHIRTLGRGEWKAVRRAWKTLRWEVAFDLYNIAATSWLRMHSTLIDIIAPVPGISWKIICQSRGCSTDDSESWTLHSRDRTFKEGELDHPVEMRCVLSTSFPFYFKVYWVGIPLCPGIEDLSYSSSLTAKKEYLRCRPDGQL